MPRIVSIPSRKIEVEFPDDLPDEEIDAYLQEKYPRSGEDVAFEVEQANQQSLEGAVTVNPFEGENKMSRDDYLLLQEYKASKKSSLGDLLGIATDVAGQVFSDVGKGLTEAGAAALVGEFSPAVQSAAEGIAAGTVGMYDIGKRILNPKKNIPTKEEFLKGRVPTGEIISRPDTGTGIVGQVGQIQYRPATEQDYNDLIDNEMQKDAEAVNRLYLMEDIIRGAPIEEIARGASYADATTLASLGAGAAAKLGAKTLFKAGGGQLARTAPGAVGQAALTAAEKTAGAVQGVASVPGRVINKVGEVVGQVFPGGAPAAKATAVTGAVIGDMGVSLGTAAATEKAAELAGTAARLAKGEKARAGLLERIALNPDVNPITRKIAAGAAQFSPAYYAAGTLLKEGAKGAAVGSAVGAGLGYLAEGDLEGAAAGLGAGFAIGSTAGVLRSSFDLTREMVGLSTSRTRQQATGDINRFIAERPSMEQQMWTDTANKLSDMVGVERAAAQMDALRIAEANGATIRLATADEMAKWTAPGWTNSVSGKSEIVLNPKFLREQTAAHETSHVLFGSLLNRAFKTEIEQVIFGSFDPVTGKVVKPGIFDDVALARISAQMAKSYSRNKTAQSEFLGHAKTLASRTNAEMLAKARKAIADELVATYTEKLMDRLRPGRFNPDRLPLLYRKIFDGIDESVRNAFGTVLFEKGMNLRFDNTTKTLKDANGKTIRIPELDALIKNAFSRPEVRAARAAKVKPDLIPVSMSDRAVWARSYGGAKGILNDDLTPKSISQINDEALRRWQDKTQRLSALSDTDKIGLEFTKDKNGQTVITARGKLSQAAIDIIVKGDALDDSAEAVLRGILDSWQTTDKSTFDTRYYGVYDRGKGSSKMVAGVKSASQNEILPYSIEANSKDGIIIRAVDMTKVRERLSTALNKPQFKDLYKNPADALKDFKRYLENLTNPVAMESAMLFGGGEIGAKKRNLFYDTLGFRLRNGESLVNVPESTITKSQNTIKSYRVERFAKLQKSGFAFPFEEATTYERVMKNFQPDAFTRETLPNGEAMTNPDGYRILKKTGSSLFRVYDDKGELIGVAKNELGAMRMAQRKFIDGWHGSPHNFMRFLTQKIGTGEGVQAFGYGLYIAESKKTGESYKNALGRATINGQDARKWLSQQPHSLFEFAKQQGLSAPEAAEAFAATLPKIAAVDSYLTYGDNAEMMLKKPEDKAELKRLLDSGEMVSEGNLYRVQLNVLPEQLLDWDKPLSEQSEKVRDAFRKWLGNDTEAFDAIQTQTGGEWYGQWENQSRAKFKSEMLASMGIPGIRYLDGGSRFTGEGTHNYVIFDDGLIRILDRNGKPVGKRLFRDVAEEGYNVRFQPDDTTKATKEEKQTRFQPVTPESPDIRFQPSSLTARDINTIAKEVGGGEVKGGAKKFGAFMRSMRDKGITLRDVVKSYGITLSSIQRKEQSIDTVRNHWPDAPFESGTKVRPEDAFAALLGTPEGQRYLNAAEKGVFDESAVDTLMQKFKGFGLQNTLKNKLKIASEEFFPKASSIIDAVNNMPSEQFAEFVRSNIPNISYGKIGFWSGQLGRGDIPTFDSRLQKLVYGKKVNVTNKILMEHRDRLTQLGINVPSEYKDFAQTLLHHEVWDRLNQTDTEHAPIKQAMLLFQPDTASPSILNGSNGTRIIKSPSGKFRVYSVTGTLLGIRDTEQAAKKLATK